jgi:uncharacterized oligopeptide transporter (OPT) family protein
VLALSIAAVVCIAASNGGTTSQDLKTGFLVGATPYWQQWAIMIGSLTSALVIGGTLMLFNLAGTVYTRQNLPQVVLSTQQFDALTDRATFEGKEYRVWRPRSNEFQGVPGGKYYVDESRRPAVLVDPAITGNRKVRDDGSEVKMKFDAPKTQVMGIIINGVLERTLNWGLVLLGAMLAVGIELCGTSSLAFAVGVYIKMEYTSPIFIGGVIAWLVGLWTNKGKKPEDEAAAIAEAETSPGTLLASGYIAGGTLAAVGIAFMEFSPALKNAINYQTNVQNTFMAKDWFPLFVFSILAVVLLIVAGRGAKQGDK